MIVRAAIIRDGGVWSVPKPGRHCHVLNLMREHGLPKRVAVVVDVDVAAFDVEVGPHDVQGFLTDTGMFLDRKRALRHAAICGEVPPEWEHTHNELFSEDLW
jgi:hypothetical protein